MEERKQAVSRSGANQSQVLHFALYLWIGVAVIAMMAPWPYTLVVVLFATFLHFAALDGDTSSREFARRKS